MPEPIRTSAWKSAFGSVKAFVLKAVNTGMSFNDFYKVAQDTGISYQRQRMLTDWQNVAGVYQFQGALNKLDASTIIPSRYVTENAHSVNYNYLAAIEFTYTDPTTGKDVVGMRMIDSNELSTREDYINRAIDVYKEGSPYHDPSAREFKLRFVESRKGL